MKTTADMEFRPGPPIAAMPPGPGTELHRALAELGFDESPGCQCASRLAEMNARGVEWCEANVDVILGWLAEAARARGLPFWDAFARPIVRKAIERARQEHAPRTTQH